MSIMTRKTAGLLTAFAIMSVAAAPMFAQQPAAEKASAAAARPAVAAEESEAPAPKKPGTEGVKVHGHWVMDLKDKDGTIIDHRDFENALVPISGTQVLVSLLTGSWTPGNYYMSISHAPVFPSNGVTGYLWQIYPSPPNPTASTCTSTFFQGPETSYTCVPGLNVQTPINSSGPNTITLRGAFTPNFNVSIDTVESGVGVCIPQYYLNPNAVSPAVCTSGALPSGYYQNSAPFTATTLSNPIAVAQGQQLVVTVTLSFS
jgi:hypothetical protein